jgi:hypothetical protein
MTFLWIFLAIVALIVFLLNCKVKIIFRFDGKPKIHIHYLLIRLGQEKSIRLILGNKEKRKKKKSFLGAPLYVPPKDKKIDILGFAEFLGHVAWVVKENVLDYLTHTRVDLKELKVSVSGDDASKTAMNYGKVVQAANGLCEVLREYSDFRWNDKNLSIEPNFIDAKDEFSLHLVLSTKLVHWIGIYFRSTLRFFE